MKKRTQKFPPEEVDFLLTVAQGREGNSIPDQHGWIRNLTPDEARDILLFRFHSIIVSLNEVCLKGKYFTSYTKTFIKLFSKNKPLQEVANMLKRDLSCYTKEELFHTGQVSILLAIQECKSNLASAIVYQFKEQIDKLLQDKNKRNSKEDNLEETIPDTSSFEGDIYFMDFLDRLTLEERAIADKLIMGEVLEKDEKIPPSLKKKLIKYIST
jgi:hypothetical protein